MDPHSIKAEQVSHNAFLSRQHFYAHYQTTINPILSTTTKLAVQV